MDEKHLELLFLLNAAITNLRLYPTTNPVIQRTMDNLFLTLQDFLQVNDEFILAEAEKNLLINGTLLEKSDQERPQVKSLLDIMNSFKIKSISLEKGVTKEELLTFLELISRLKLEKDLKELLQEAKINSIAIDKKVFIANTEETQLLASLDIKDEEVIRLFLGEEVNGRIDIEKIKEKARDRVWLTSVFKASMRQFMLQKGLISSAQLSLNLMHMLAFLDKIVSQSDLEKILPSVTEALLEFDGETISSLFCQEDIDKLFGGKLIANLLETMDEGKFYFLVEKFKQLGLEDKSATLLASERGKKYKKEREAGESVEKNEKGQKYKEILNKVQLLIEGSKETGLSDFSFLSSLPEYLKELFSEDREREAIDLVKALSFGLLKEEAKIRSEVAATICSIFECCPIEKRRILIKSIIDNLAVWLQNEDRATIAYEKIAYFLKEEIKDSIKEREYTLFISIVDVYYRISMGVLEKNDTISEIANEIIQDLATPPLLEILLKDFSEGEENYKDMTGRFLMRLGDKAQNRLLDLLKEHDDSNERVRILHLFSEIGPSALSTVKRRINPQEPWYFLRNIAYLLGRLGTHEAINLLKPLLLDKNEKVRDEALKSLYRLEGEQRGKLLLSLFPELDEKFKPEVVETLGKMKYKPAVPYLLDILQDRPRIPSPERVELEEKICLAMGKIGDKRAIPVLTEVSRAKRFLFSKKVYPLSVQKAAAKALTTIRVQESRG